MMYIDTFSHDIRALLRNIPYYKHFKIYIAHDVKEQKDPFFFL